MVSHCACPTRGVRDRALHEHRRPSSLPFPSCLFLPLSQAWRPCWFHCGRRTRPWYFPTPLFKGSGQGCLRLRASNEHIPIVRVPRARKAPGRFPSYLPKLQNSLVFPLCCSMSVCKCLAPACQSSLVSPMRWVRKMNSSESGGGSTKSFVLLQMNCSTD